jgi:serine/threonine-protein kinase HipA
MSLSGAQDKMTVFIDNHGALSLPLGTAPSSHIIKPSMNYRQDIPCTAINECLIMQLAKHIGLNVADVRYAPELSAVIVTRYDRWTDPNHRLRRLHQNDLCQVLGVPSGKKYESEGGPSLKACFDAVQKHSTRPVIDKKRLLEWVIFNVLVGNRDSHAKNLSLLISEKNTQLAPFYDLVCTAVYNNLSQKFAFKIGGENRPKWMMTRHWERFADDIDVPFDTITQTQTDLMARIESALPVVSKELSVRVCQPDALAMIDNIQAFVMQSIAQTKLKANGLVESVDVASYPGKR